MIAQEHSPAQIIEQKSSGYLKKKYSVMKYFANIQDTPSNTFSPTRSKDIILPSLNTRRNTLKKYRTIDYEDKNTEIEIKKTLPYEYRHKAYSKQEVQKIRNEVEEQVVQYKNKYLKPNGAALCPKLSLIQGRRNFERAQRKKSKSLFTLAQEKKNSKTIDVSMNNQISTCSYEQSLFFG